MRYVRVPMDRIGVVIGPDGETKQMIERRGQVTLDIDSDSGEIEIDDRDAEDPLMPLMAEDVVRALGRGFSPEHALKLFNDDYYIQIFDVHDYVGKKKKNVERIVGRVVGADGKTRRILEELTGCHLSIYGHTVSMISDIDSMEAAKTAIDMLLSGSEHASVYRFLENKRREQRMARMDL